MLPTGVRLKEEIMPFEEIKIFGLTDEECRVMRLRTGIMKTAEFWAAPWSLPPNGWHEEAKGSAPPATSIPSNYKSLPYARETDVLLVGNDPRDSAHA